MKTNWFAWISLSFLFLMGQVFADSFSLTDSNLDYVLHDLEQNAATLQQNTQSCNPQEAQIAVRRLDRVIYDLNRAKNQLSQIHPISHGGWFAVQGQECNRFCQSMGLFSALSYEGAQCVSGENRAASAAGIVQYTNGCFPNCSSENYSAARSEGAYCYKPGQKKDNDRTDITMGCFCR